MREVFCAMTDHRSLVRARASCSSASLFCGCTGTLLVLATACGSGTTAPAAADIPFRIQVSNALIAPVTVSIDGTALAILDNGKATSLTVSSKAHWLTWTSAKPAGPDGEPIADQLGEVKIPVSNINGSLEIGNVVNDETYITARIFNTTTSQVAIGVTDGATVYCAGTVPAASPDGVNGFVQIGYYRLLPSTEVRAYRGGSRCTGPYLAWPESQLIGFAAKSGLVTLLLQSAP